jgi:hypothetical protein
MIEALLSNKLALAYFSAGPIILIYFGIKSWNEYRERSDFIKSMQEMMGSKPTLKDQIKTYAMYFLAGIIILVAWPVFVAWLSYDKYKDYRDMLERRKPKFFCTNEYLIRKISPLEAEKDSLVIDPLGMAPSIPFGHLNAAWCEFLAKIEASDEVWLYEIPKGSMTGKDYNRASNLMRGYAHIRRKKIIGEFVRQSG